MGILKSLATKILGTEISSRSTDPNFYATLQVLPNPDIVLRQLGQNHRVYEAILADAHVLSEIRPMRAGVISFKWKLTAGGGQAIDAKALAAAQVLFNKDPAPGYRWSDVFWNMFQAVLRGYSVHEVVWEPVEGLLQPVKIIDRPERRFVFDPADNGLRLLNRESMAIGVPTDPYKFLVARHMPSYDNPYGVAVLSSCFWPYTFKHNGFRFFVKFCEKYGIPWAIGKYPEGTSVAQQNALADALAKMVEDAVAAIPSNGDVELIEPSRSADSQSPQERLIAVCNSEMSKALSCQTLATEIQGHGSYAAAQTHKERAMDVNAADREIVVDALNELLKWFSEINFQGAAPPKFEFYDEAEARKDWLDVFTGAKEFLDIPLSFAHQQLQIPVPAEGEAILPKSTAAPATDAQFNAAVSGSTLPADIDPTPVTDYTGQLSTHARPVINQWMDFIKAKVETADSLEALQSDLLAMYGDLPTEDLSKIMSLGFAAADLAGRWDVKQGN